MMIYILLFVAVLSLPHWLPNALTFLRVLVFRKINGQKGLEFPNPAFDAGCLRKLYEHPKVRGRSRGAELSDLFWYWLSPGAYIHQEHLEDGPDYEKLSAFTKEKLNVSRKLIDPLVISCFKRFLLLKENEKASIVRIRDYMIPLWAVFYYELVFNEKCSEEACQLIATHANDVVTALKCCGLRHMKKREALSNYLREKLKNNNTLNFPDGFSLDDQVYFLQGTFFNTAVVQMSDAMSQLIMTVSKNVALQDKMAENTMDKALYNHVISETLRLYPLFGIAHRISSEDITIDNKTITKGTVICFNYEAYQKIGFENPNQFQPDRWDHCPIKHENNIPFGMVKNRMCPAQAIALNSMKKLLQLLLENYSFVTSARQTRALVNRAPVFVWSRKKIPSVRKTKLILLMIQFTDQWESIYLSFLQLILGAMMVLEAKKLKLATNYFRSQDSLTGQDRHPL